MGFSAWQGRQEERRDDGRAVCGSEGCWCTSKDDLAGLRRKADKKNVRGHKDEWDTTCLSYVTMLTSDVGHAKSTYISPLAEPDNSQSSANVLTDTHTDSSLSVAVVQRLQIQNYLRALPSTVNRPRMWTTVMISSSRISGLFGSHFLDNINQ